MRRWEGGIGKIKPAVYMHISICDSLLHVQTEGSSERKTKDKRQRYAKWYKAVVLARREQNPRLQ